jgi:hypothetical protein
LGTEYVKVLAQFGLRKADYERMSLEELGEMGNGRDELGEGQKAEIYV